MKNSAPAAFVGGFELGGLGLGGLGFELGGFGLGGLGFEPRILR